MSQVETLTPAEKTDKALAARPDPNPKLLEDLDLVPEEDMLDLADVTRNTSEMWQRRRTGPPRIRIGNRYYYPKSGILKYIEDKISKQ